MSHASGITTRLETIALRVRELAERDPFRAVFGAEVHEYRLAPPATERTLCGFESRHGVRLPAAYRGFLSRVADGGAGPSYGLLPLAKASDAFLDGPFPFRSAHARRVMKRRVSGVDPYAFVGDGEAVPGLVALCDDGCGWITYLVVSGEQRGKVWTGGELGYCPQYFLRDGEPVQHTFLSWYESWSRRTYRETRPKAFETPRGTRFNLNGKLVGKLPDALFECTRVEELSLSGNKLEQVPEGIGALKNLRSLDLGGNLLAALPEAIGELHGLEELHLAYNRSTEPPSALGRLASLRVLGLQSNPLRELPPSMSSLRLRRLALGYTAVTHLPSWLSELGLEELQLEGVHLHDWNDLRGLHGLKQLWLSMNAALDRIPDAVFELVSLEVLILGATGITEIPPDIVRLRNLKTLGLANTCLRSLPDELGSLPQLTRVVLQSSPVPPDELQRARERWPQIEFS